MVILWLMLVFNHLEKLLTYVLSLYFKVKCKKFNCSNKLGFFESKYIKFYTEMPGCYIPKKNNRKMC